MEPEAAAHRFRSIRAAVALAALLVLVVATETGTALVQPSTIRGWEISRRQTLTAALATAQRLYDDARTNNLADAQRIASSEAIGHMLEAWSEAPRPRGCSPESPADRLADHEITCSGVADAHLLILWLDHAVGSLTFEVRDVTTGWCDPPSSLGSSSCYFLTEPGQ